jgi:hypothetical protein
MRILEETVKTLNNRLILSLTTVCLMVAGTAAKADSFTITLSSPVQNGSSGEVVSFDATVTNNEGATVYLNGDNTYVDSPLAVDDSPYNNNYPLSLGPGDSDSGALFNVDLPAGTPVGDYVVVTPEPSALLLLATGLLGLAGRGRKAVHPRRKTTSQYRSM